MLKFIFDKLTQNLVWGSEIYNVYLYVTSTLAMAKKNKKNLKTLFNIVEAP